MKGCLCTLYTDEFEQFIEPVRARLAHFAALSGMDFVMFNHALDPSKSPSWNKMHAIESCFRRGYNEVLWADADSLPRRGAPFFTVPTPDLVTNQDENGICMSHVFMRNTGFNRQLIATILFLGDVRNPSEFGINTPGDEQNALKAVIRNYAAFETPAAFPHGFVVPIATHPHWQNEHTTFLHLCSMSIEDRVQWVIRLLKDGKVA